MNPVRPQPVLEPVEPLPAPVPPDDGAGEAESLNAYVDVLVEGRWIIAAATALALALGGAYALLARPVYQSDALVQVEERKSGASLLGDLPGLFAETSPAETEIEILRSRAILGQVVRELRLQVTARPHRFPIVGRTVARWRAARGASGPLLGLRSFAWGGERIAFERLEVPAPLLGKPLTLVAGGAGTWTLRAPEGATLLEGKVGAPASAGGVEAFVSELVATPGTRFDVAAGSVDDATAALQADLKVSEKGRKTGILRLALDGESPRQIAGILDAVARAYVRQNVERKSAEAQKTLEFLESQLPVLRSDLAAAEADLEHYRSRTGSVDVGLEAQAAIARAVEIEKGATELKVELAALRRRFTDEHPAIAALRDRLKRLEAERAALEVRIKALPTSELESARRLRNEKVANELYITVLNKAQELKVVKEGTVGNVRILDVALVPRKPVSPRRFAILAGALAVGLLGGVLGAFVRRALDRGLEDPDAIERATGIGVHASVPFSEPHADADRRARRGRTPLGPLAERDPRDIAVESLRSLRTSLQFALVEQKNAIVAVTGPAPSVGKSFVVANLAHLIGETGKRVAVVDADLRRGALHLQYGGERAPGLSDVLAGGAPLERALRPTGSEHVRFLPTGTVPPNPSELLASERFQRLLGELAATHDVVLVDTPPVLAVTDAAVVGRLAGVNLLVLRSGEHSLREVVAAIRQLGRNGVRPSGIVLNSVRLERGLGRKNYFHYQYRY